MVAKLETVNVRNTFQKIVKEKPHCSHSSNIFEPLIRRGKNPHGNSSSFGAYGFLLARCVFTIDRKFTSYV